MATPTPTTGTSTPMQLDPEETTKSLRVSLADLSAKAAALYAHKQYEDASEVYAQAAEMQAEMNGEMNPENAEILFLYGRALFKVGQSKSDVLGGKAPETKKQPKPAKAATSKKGSAPATASKEDGGDAAAQGAANQENEEPKPEQKKALFQFQGDENFTDSEEEEEEEEGEGEGEEEEEDDDLAMAFEILDLARLLFNKRLEEIQAEDEAQQGKGKEVAETGNDSATVKHIKERLADTHDLLAEISLENERYVAGS
jgi:HAT1-interacting factor 1